MYNTRRFQCEHFRLTLSVSIAVCFLVLCGVSDAVQRTPPIFMNQFGVRINSEDTGAADRIADKHGFVNLGQVRKGDLVPNAE